MDDEKKESSPKRDDKEKGKGIGKSSAKVPSRSDQSSSKSEQGSFKNEQGSSKGQGTSGSNASKKSPDGDKAEPEPVLKQILAELKSLSKKQNDMGEQMDSQVRILTFFAIKNYLSLLYWFRSPISTIWMTNGTSRRARAVQKRKRSPRSKATIQIMI